MRVNLARVVPADIVGRLKAVGAPQKLRDWVRAGMVARGGASVGVVEQLWEQCDKPTWLMWLAAADEVPLLVLVEAAADCAAAATRHVSHDSVPLLMAIEAARAMQSLEQCSDCAERCEAAAENPERANYRTAPPSRYRWASSSAAYAARAAEGLLRAEVVRATRREAVGRERAAAIGAGEHIIDPGEQAPLVFDLEDEWVRYSFDAALSAIGHALQASLPVAPTSEQVEDVEAAFSDIVFSTLGPPRSAMAQGVAPARLVRTLDALSHKTAVSATPPAKRRKRPRDAFLAACLMPLGGGHHFAEHNSTGAILSLAIISSGIMAAYGVVPWLTPVLMVVADAALAPAATVRRNEGTIYAKKRQWLIGLAVVGAALLLGMLS